MYVTYHTTGKHPHSVVDEMKQGIYKVLVEEIDKDEHDHWYLVELTGDLTRFNDNYDTDDEDMARPYVSPDYKGAENHSCRWVPKHFFKEAKIDIASNHEALYLLKTDL